MGSSTFEDKGSRPLYIMTNSSTNIVDISQITYALFISTLVSYREHDAHYVNKFIYTVDKKDEKKEIMLYDSYQNIHYVYNNVPRPDPIYDFPKIIGHLFCNILGF